MEYRNLYDRSKLIGDPDNLTGIIVITTQMGSASLYQIAIGSSDSNKLRLIVKDPINLEDILSEDFENQKNRIRDDLKQKGHNSNFGFYVVGGITNRDISTLIDKSGDYDQYPINLNVGPDEFANQVSMIATGYFLEHYMQESKKKQKGVVTPMNVYEIPQSEILKKLLKLSTKLLNAVGINDPIGQLEAEDTLRQFTSSPALKYSTEEIIKLASSTEFDRSGKITLHCRIMESVVKEKYELASVIQKRFL